MRRTSHVGATLLAFALTIPAGGTAASDEGTPTPDDGTSFVPEVVEEAAAATEQAVYTFGDDLRDFPRRMWRDLRSLPTRRNAALLAVTGGLARASHELWDDDVRDEITGHPRRFGRDLNHVIDNGGESYNQLAAAGVLYGTSLLFDSPRLQEFSLDAVHALSIEIPLVFGLKRALPSSRPDGGPRGFPSGHVASTSAIAAILHESYGPVAGAAGYAFTGLVAFHRLDVGKHDLSDVIFGAALGYVIGSTTARNETLRLAGFELSPFADPPSGSRGLALARRF